SDLADAADGDVNGSGAYLDHAKYYFERTIDAEAVRAVMAGEPLTAELVRALNSGADFAEVAKIARRAGYPVGQAVLGGEGGAAAPGLLALQAIFTASRMV